MCGWVNVRYITREQLWSHLCIFYGRQKKYSSRINAYKPPFHFLFAIESAHLLTLGIKQDNSCGCISAYSVVEKNYSRIYDSNNLLVFFMQTEKENCTFISDIKRYSFNMSQYLLPCYGYDLHMTSLSFVMKKLCNKE